MLGDAIRNHHLSTLYGVDRIGMPQNKARGRRISTSQDWQDRGHRHRYGDSEEEQPGDGGVALSQEL